MQYLGFNIGRAKVWPIQDKVEVLGKPAPTTTRKELQRFLGLANYYRRIVPQFSMLAAPLTDLLKGGGKETKAVHLIALGLTAFKGLKRVLCDQTHLHMPLSTLPFMVHTDASSTGVGAMLSQETNQGERQIYHLSRKLNPTKRKYAVIEKEALAIRWAVDQLKYYLWGQEFTVITDHAPLQWLARMKDTNSRLMRCFLALPPYHFTIKYRKESERANADFVSRQTVWASLERQAYLAGERYVSLLPLGLHHHHPHPHVSDPRGPNGDGLIYCKPPPVSQTAEGRLPRHLHGLPTPEQLTLPMGNSSLSWLFVSGTCL